jgi:hypothetical protein
MIFYKLAPRAQHSIELERSIFIEDLTLSYSISFSNRTNKDDFYKIVPTAKGSIFEYLREGYYDFTRYDLDKLLSHITHELITKGESFVVLDEDIKDGSLQSWHLRTVPWQSYRSHKNALTIKQGNNECTRTETFEKEKVLRFSLKDIGLSGDVFRKAMSRIQRTSLTSRVKPEFFYNKNYDYFQHSKACDLEFLSATKHIYWNGRSYNDQYVSVPYVLYKQGKWLQLRLTIFNYLMNKINEFIKDYSKQYDLTGEIQYNSCFSMETITTILSQYSLGEISTTEIMNYFRKNLITPEESST